MCRIICIPSGTTRKLAVEIIQNFAGDKITGHHDGCGEVHAQNGQFVVNKYAQSVLKVLKKDKPFLNNMEERTGWTLVHLRRASVGNVCKENSHPHISLNGEIALVHNGTMNVGLFGVYMQTIEGFNSNTDSAVLGELISRIGMPNFVQCIDFGGVFAALQRDGSLEIGKVSGDLSMHLNTKDRTCLMASEFPADIKNIELKRGFFKFSPTGHYIRHVTKEFPVYKGNAAKNLYGNNVSVHVHGRNFDNIEAWD